MKKKILILSSMLVFSLTVYCQQIFVGGNLSLGTEKEKTKGDNYTVEGDKYFYFTLMPKVGYFINNNIAIGGSIGFAYDMREQTDNDKTKNSIFYIGPFARYYLRPTENAGIFIEGAANFGFGSEKFEDDQGNTTVITKTDLGSLNIGLTPGVFFNISNKITLELEAGWIGFSSEYTKSGEVKEITNSFDFIINSSSLQIGLTFNF